MDEHENLLFTDFGYSFFINEENAIQPTWPLTKNRYAAWWTTPPELFDSMPQTTPLSADQYKKIESWAVGCMLYECGYPTPKWIIGLMKKEFVDAGSIPMLSPDEREAMRREHQKLIEDELTIMTHNPQLLCKPTGHYSYTIYNLMRTDVSLRWTLEQADAYLQKHSPSQPALAAAYTT